MPEDKRSDATSLRIQKAADGDGESVAWLITRFSPVVLAAARRRLDSRRYRCEPEDLVQEVWAILLPRLDRLRPRDGKLTPVLLRYLSTTLLQLCNNLARRELGGHTNEFHSSLSAETTGIVTRAIRHEACAELERCLEKLAAQDREVVILRGIEQIPNKVVATLLGEPADTVSARYRRALVKLRRMMPNGIFDEID